jgi:hypothetical protein
MQEYETLNLGDKVMIKHNGLAGEITGMAAYTWRVPQVCIQFIDRDLVLMAQWLNFDQVTKDFRFQRESNVVQFKSKK